MPAIKWVSGGAGGAGVCREAAEGMGVGGGKGEGRNGFVLNSQQRVQTPL